MFSAPGTANATDQQSALTESVAQLIDDARQQAITADTRAVLDETRARLVGPLRVAIAGKVKAGKSTLLNALVGEELAPTDAGECTQIVTWYADGDHPQVTLHPRNGPPTVTTFTRRGALDVSLAGHAAAEIESIDVRWPSSRLRNLTLIDTPGTESLSTDLSARTLDLLTPDEDRPPVVDAVLYLLRHAHASDARFLEAFHADELANGTPLNTVGVLSRADEIGLCRVDALEVAHRVADRYRADSRLRRLCPVIVPVAGLLAHAGVTLREREFRLLARIASMPATAADDLLLTADRFATGPDPDLPAADRAQLLDRLGLFGVRLGVELIRTTVVADSVQLAAELKRRSGLDELGGVLLRQFAERSQILKARSSLLSLNAVVRAGGCRESDRLLSRSEQIVAGAHAFEEVRLLDQVRSESFAFHADRLEEMERLLGGSGHDPVSRLGLPENAEPAAIRARIEDALQRWQMVVEHPLSGRNEQRAARGVCRSLEGLLIDLPA